MKIGHGLAQYLDSFISKFGGAQWKESKGQAPRLNEQTSEILFTDGPSLRPDSDSLVLRSADYVPGRRIARQIASGRAYFERYNFSMEARQPSFTRVSHAVHDLAARSPKLKLDSVAPEVSIIIPVYGQVHFVLNCLDSLFMHESRFSAEIIVIDDATPEKLRTEELKAVPWIRYIRRNRNGGFIETCNAAASSARGTFVLFLNSDIRVAEGWLDELIGTFAIVPKAGLVGSKLYNENGTLQDAGGIFWRDGSAWNYGRSDDGDHPKYCFARQVDYCSGASIALPKAAWEEMKGFDDLFKPAYCEDADLAFRLRKAGYEVWIQPLSCALHYEGRTHGRTTDSGIKAYQTINMKKFYDRWKDVLLCHRPDGEEPDQEANRCAVKRLLVLDAESPMPNRDCGSIFVVHMLAAMKALGYQITFAPHFTYFFDGQYTEDLQRIGIECLYGPFFGGIDDILESRNDFDVVLVYRHYVLRPVYETIRQEMPLARIVFSNVDLHYLREAREAELFNSQRARNAAMITKASEFEALCRADCSIVHTEDEAKIILQQTALENLVELPYVAEAYPSLVGRDDRFDLMFLGGFRHAPNVDAMLYFRENVWPNLLQSLPARARLLIVGASPPPEIQRLACERIVVTGFVEDLTPWFDAARVFVAPLRFGAGIKGKVIESLRHGTPSVITPVAAEGIGISSGVDALIADIDEDFVDAVLRLYEDPLLWEGMQSAGYELVRKRFSQDKFVELCEKVLRTADTVWTRRHENALKQRLVSLGSGHSI